MQPVSLKTTISQKTQNFNKLDTFAPINIKTNKINNKSLNIKQNTSFNCNNNDYLSQVVLPFIEEKLPARDSTTAKSINHLTNAYDLIDSLKQDMCLGKISEQSARETIEFVARGSSSAISTVIGVKLALLGSILGPAGTAAGAGTGMALLKVAPDIAAQVGDKVFDGFQEFLSKTADFVKSQRNR